MCYTCPYSESRSLKIRYIADAQEWLFVGGENSQCIALLMEINRMTECKETTKVLSQACSGSLYTDIYPEFC